MVLRGADTYKNLPNKTLRLLRYALAHPAGGGSSRLLSAVNMNHQLSAPAEQQPLCLQASPDPAAAAIPHSAAGYTHVMKTDDDCYVRISKVRGFLAENSVRH